MLESSPRLAAPIATSRRPFTPSLLAGVALLAVAAHVADAAQITPGNLVAVRVGDGTAALTSASTAVFLDEFTTAGVFVQTIPLPTAASGANQPLTNSGSATSEGLLNLSADGRFLVHAGYGTAPGLPSIAGTTSVAVPRVAALVDIATGNVDTTTALDAFSGGNPRSATSQDGSALWLSGSNSGVLYATTGATTALALNMAPTNTRMVQIVAGQLYLSSASSTFQGVSAVGTGLPTTAGQTVTLLPGFPTATGPSSYDYFFADAATLYVADDRTAAQGGGIQKWTESAGTWTLQYTLSVGTSGARSLTGVVQGGAATLYATTTATSANNVVVGTDTGVGTVFTTVTTAPANTAYRGLRLVPSAGSPFAAYCFGDGTATACPCGNVGVAGNGCPNSINAAGAHLAATGNASIAADTVVLAGTGMPNSSALYFQGTAQQSGGLGVVFGDGLRCAGGSVIRLATKFNAAGASQFPAGGDPSVSVRGLVASPGSRTYQCWYRNAAAFCTASTFNLTNGVGVTWGT